MLSVQCLEKCREDICSKLGLEPSDVELSMGMSQDYEKAVRHLLFFTPSAEAAVLPSLVH